MSLQSGFVLGLVIAMLTILVTSVGISRFNVIAAIRDLERSTALNDNRQLFHSRLALDRDLAIRNAQLAALYRDAGLPAIRGMTIGPIENALHPGVGYGSLACGRSLDASIELGATFVKSVGG